MNTNRFTFWSLLVGAGLALPLSLYGQQTPAQTDRDEQQQQQQVTKENAEQRAASKDVIHRASDVIGMTVKNNSQQDLGKVHDIVVDAKTGKIEYLALSYGGLLGLGDKLFAIPLDAFSVRMGEDSDDYHLVLSVDEETLKSGPGFNEDEWPDFADPQWRTKLEQHYRKSSRNAAATDRAATNDVQDRVNNNSVTNPANGDDSVLSSTADRERNADNAAADKTAAKDTILRVSKIQDMKVKGRDNKDLGEVEDVVLNLKEGKIEYLALSYGGILGIGDKLFAVPFDVFTLRQSDQDDEYFLAVNLSESQLKSAPGFEEDSWPNLADRRWRDEVDRHYSAERPDETPRRERR